MLYSSILLFVSGFLFKSFYWILAEIYRVIITIFDQLFFSTIIIKHGMIAEWILFTFAKNKSQNNFIIHFDSYSIDGDKFAIKKYWFHNL